jgi:allantoinase
MARYDLLLRNGLLVTPEGVERGDVAVEGGKIVEVGPQIEGEASQEIDADGLHVFPGVIDVHLHFNEPGRTQWEGFATGSRAAAAGGTTTYFDMPLNSHPPVIDAEAFDLKRAAAEASSLVDFGLWGGLVPGDVDRLDELAARGVVGFKAFMSNSGIEDFPAVDDLTLYEGMARAAKLGKIVAVHAESDTITARLAQRAIAAGRTGVRDFLRSRPAVAELEAVVRAIFFARETGCALHVVHVSTGRAAAVIAAARAQSIDVSYETCPHYLALTEEDVERLGAVAKCAPPLRTREEQDTLWDFLANGELPIVASDHSPAPPNMKQSEDFFKVWGGISGCQSLLEVLLTEGLFARKIPLNIISRVTATQPARRFGIAPAKGHIAPGADADFAIVDPGNSRTLRREDLFYRHAQSPYVGMEMRGRVVRTILRGTTVWQDGKIVSGPLGRLVRA